MYTSERVVRKVVSVPRLWCFVLGACCHQPTAQDVAEGILVPERYASLVPPVANAYMTFNAGAYRALGITQSDLYAKHNVTWARDTTLWLTSLTVPLENLW